MIIVEVKLLSASTGKTTSLGHMHICNDGTGLGNKGNYDIEVFNKAGRSYKKSRVENWPRQAKPPMRLIQKVLNTVWKI